LTLQGYELLTKAALAPGTISASHANVALQQVRHAWAQASCLSTALQNLQAGRLKGKLLPQCWLPALPYVSRVGLAQTPDQAVGTATATISSRSFKMHLAEHQDIKPCDKHMQAYNCTAG
jgi:hypothetical protein